VRLQDVLEEVDVTKSTADPGVTIEGLAYDSRRVRRGDLFFGLSGTRMDGTRFVADALHAGAAAAVVATEAPTMDGPIVRVRDPRKALALAACRFHGEPSHRLAVVGVTGTNGKTTTTWLCEGVFRAAGRDAGLIGTTGYRIGGVLRPAPFTTPEAPELQALLAEMVAAGVGAVAIELSSHALAQRRSHGLACDVAVFTNLTHDHLDYHGTMERYLDAKLMLFDGRNETRPVKRTTAVVNADDPAVKVVRDAAARGGMRCVTYGFDPRADLRITDHVLEPDGQRFTLEPRHGEATPVRIGLLGRYNASNAAAAFAAARALSIPADRAAAGLAAVAGVPGRLERVDAGQPFGVVVDYAHTPDALTQALGAARDHARGRVLVVFGCGGDRDRAKRPEMGRAAAAGSDRAWVTSDNPRSEPPEAIAAEVVAGAPAGAFEVVLDRRAAITAALSAAGPGDVVLIAGKGHETTQTIGDRVLPFDDREVARAVLEERAGTWR